jgi:hypothetical protein
VQTLARWDRAEREKGPRSKPEGLPAEKLSREVGHDDRAKTENGAPDLHREVDTKDFVFAEAEALSTRAVAPPPGKHFSTDAHENSPQPGIRRINRSAHHEIEHRGCRVFLDPARNDHRRPARRYVPLGETPRQAREGSRVLARNAPGRILSASGSVSSPLSRAEVEFRAADELEASEEGPMCPACIASTAAMVAGALSTGGILVVCIGRFRKFVRANGLGLPQKTKEK